MPVRPCPRSRSRLITAPPTDDTERSKQNKPLADNDPIHGLALGKDETEHAHLDGQLKAIEAKAEADPIKGRHVATLGALRARYAPRLQQSRDGFVTDLIHRGDRTPAGRGSLPVSLR